MEADCRLGSECGEETKPERQGCSEMLRNSLFRNPPHRSERTRWRWQRRGMAGVLPVLLLVLLVEMSTPVCSLIFSCELVKSCICGRDDGGGWRIDCPNDLREKYPIEIQVQRLSKDNHQEASLTIQCNDDGKTADPWPYIKGMDLSTEQVEAKVVRLEIRYCPTVVDGWASLFKKVNITGDTLRMFSFVTEDRSDTAKSIQIPSNFFSNMPNIAVLNLRDNKLTSVPNLSSLRHLSTLNLRNNDITSIPAGVLSANTRLSSVAFTFNKVSEIAADAFPESVEHLELNNNQISFVNSSAFSNLINLKRLFLNSNPLDRLDSETFVGLPSLEELRLYNSYMTQFPTFSNMQNLVNLSISNAVRYNLLPGKDSDGGDLTTTLAPDYLPENTLVLKNLPSLKNLVLPLNHFNSLPVLENLPNLTSVDLRRNDLTEIESGAFSGLPSLEVLNFHNNKIRSLGVIRAPSLKELDVSGNYLTVLQNDTFMYLGFLKKLNLAKNQIIDVTHKTFAPLSNLEELDLSFNQVTFSSSPYANIRDDVFGDWGNRSPLKSSLNLRKLLLSHNRISRLGFSDWTDTFTQINEIDLSSNKIQHVTSSELNFIAQNLTLNLESNDIATVDMTHSYIYLEDNASGSKLMRVLLAGNPLNCDCLAYRLKIFQSESFDLRIKNVVCRAPQDLEGRKLVEVPDDKFLCPLAKSAGCPEPCACRQRPVDKTILVDCSGKNLTLEEVPPLNTFLGVLTNWVIELDLSDNLLTDFNNTTYIKGFLNKTSHINLTGNNLTSTLFLEQVGDYQSTTFAIGDNPFPCDNCKGFQIPWRAFPTRISDLANVTCRKPVAYSSKYELLFVQENSKEFEDFCATPRFSVVLVFVLVIAVIFLSVLCIVLFITIRYGWAIKAYLYSKGWVWCLFWERDTESDEDDGSEKLYDAFVSYSHKDEEWVLDELVNRLEGNDGFKLCLHFRDWTPGDWIPDQIVRSVDKSRRTIVILSKNFVESVWSRLEFKAAHAQALKERSSRVILILLGEDLKETDVSDDDLKMYMKMNTFMKWNDPLFWHRLKYALPHKRSPTPNQPTEEEQKQNAINKMQQRERAIQLNKLRAKLEQNV